MSTEWGPLAGLIGTWEGDGGLDTAFSHTRNEVLGTPYRERATFSPFGPVDNGRQSLYGLDYRSSMWRGDETLPFHTEVGYWLWDGATGEVMRCFVVPRGITTFAGGTCEPDATTFTIAARQGDPQYSIGENKYLAQHASTVAYEATVTVGDGTWSYDETTTLQMDEIPDLFAHTDHNTLHRVDGS
ncbi:MAG: heme-binding beta-barrel domain-containing protein [Microthrixaceae bacterium]